MAINKVEYGQKTLIDLTSDTVTKETLVKGTSAHNAAGEQIEGVFDPTEYLKKTDDGSNLTVAFTEAATRENISTGEKVSTVFGKIKKFFADLTAPAFAQMITTKEDLLATKVTGYVPDAKAVADGFADVNGKLPKHIDITVNCPASTWCNIALPDDILSVDQIISVNKPNDSDSNVYGIIWWPSAGKRITILRINTDGQNLLIENTAKTIKLRICFY